VTSAECHSVCGIFIYALQAILATKVALACTEVSFVYMDDRQTALLCTVHWNVMASVSRQLDLRLGTQIVSISIYLEISDTVLGHN